MNARAQVSDAAVGLGLFAVALPQMSHMDGRWRVVAVTAVVCCVLAVRRRWPVPAFAVTVVAGVAAIPASPQIPAGLAILFSAYTVGTATYRTTTLASALTAVVVLSAGGTVVAPDSWAGPNAPVTLVAAALVGSAVGDAVRSRREMVTMLRQRAWRAEQSLEEEARRQVAEERLRIAREVHDLVGHHIAVANVQARVAAHHLPDRPDAAVEALGHVRTATRAVLEESKAMLGVLRAAGDASDHAPTEPAPSLASLEALLRSCAAAGLRVDHTVVGAPRRLPSTVDLVAYRVVQESLTNAGRHGAGRARLSLAYTPDGLNIEVANAYGDEPDRVARAPGGGHGLVGMRERVAAVGGTLVTGPVQPGRFVVRAHLPAASDWSGAGA